MAYIRSRHGFTNPLKTHLSRSVEAHMYIIYVIYIYISMGHQLYALV